MSFVAHAVAHAFSVPAGLLSPAHGELKFAAAR